MRREGNSLLSISKTLCISKSTASLWLRSEANRGLYGKMSRHEWMHYIQSRSKACAEKRRIIHQEKIANLAKVEASLLRPSLKMRKVILSMLYWAEGAKRYDAVISFANTDPKLCLTFITLLRQCYLVDELKFRLMLHLQIQHNESEQKTFWSQLLSVPLTQFTKTIWKKKPNSGKRYRQNYHGICFVRYNSVELQRELTAHALAVADKLNLHP